MPYRKRRARILALQTLAAMEAPRTTLPEFMAPANEALSLQEALTFMQERALRSQFEWALQQKKWQLGRAILGDLSLLPGQLMEVPLLQQALNQAEHDISHPLGEEDLEEIKAIKGKTEELNYAETLVRGVHAKLDELDRKLSESSTNWRVSRMTMIDRNTLRIAAHELLYEPEIPAKVIINEAIEIAKLYGTQDSSAFVNGILDKLAQKCRQELGTERPS